MLRRRNEAQAAQSRRISRISLRVMDPIVAVPVKAFDTAKVRLSGRLSPGARRRLGRKLAERTLAIVREAGATPAVVTGDPAIEQWAMHLQHPVIDERRGRGTGLDAAADAAAAEAIGQGRPWLILHGDLPLLRAEDVARVIELMGANHFVLCPSYDGGTNTFAGHSGTSFAYGPASFHRHLAAVATSPHAILTSVGLALDLDSARDFATLLDHPDGRWLAAALADG